MNVLITGGAGYIGSELTEKVSNNKSVDNIVIYDNLNRSNYNLFYGKNKLDKNKIAFIKGDILDTRKLKKIIENREIDTVFHLAAKVTTPFADHNPHEFDQINNWGTAELTYLLENSNIKKLIHLSSTSVYGSSEGEYDIHSIPNPKTFYGISKLRAEDHVKRLLGSKIDTLILRSGNVYGFSRSMRLDSVINRFVFESNYENKIKITGDGNQMRSFVNVHRLTDFLSNSLTHKLESDIYNVVESTLSIQDIVEALKVFYPSLEMTFSNQNMRMRNLQVKKDLRLEKYFNNTPSFQEDLNNFVQNFSF